MITRERVLRGCAAMVAAGVLMMGGGALSGTLRDDGGTTVDVGELPSSDCWYEVGQRDDDGKPGGSKTVRVRQLCP